MTLLEVITAYLADATGLVEGTDLFRGGVPAIKNRTVSAIIQSGGVARGERPHVEATFQVLTVAASLGAAMTQAELVYAATLDNRNLPKLGIVAAGRAIALIEPLQPPADIGIDPEGQRRTSFNFRVIAEE